MRSTIALALVLFSMVACGGDDGGGDDNDAFDTYQDCWNEHTTTEHFDAQDAIEICCLDHPIGNQPMNVVCGSDAGTCEAFVGSNLTGSGVGSDSIDAACTKYITDRSM